MRILVVSDTHGYIDPVVAYINAQSTPFDGLWHLGDYYKDAIKIGHLTGLQVQAVKGNCDSYADAEDDLSLKIMGYHVLLTHGHHYGVKYSLLKIHLKAIEGYYDLVCFGHTHRVAQVREGGVKFFNPGSASEPRSGGYPSVGIVEISDMGIKTTIVPLSFI